MKHTNAKSHRLLLNTTPEGRARIQTLTLESGAATESALLRQAFDFYAMLHPRLATGDEVFMRSADGQTSTHLDISATWDGPTGPTANETSGIRQRMELKLDPAQREQLDRLVELGAAPTLTALAGEALTAYGYYVRYRNQGMLLYLRSKDGLESLVMQPASTERVVVGGVSVPFEPSPTVYQPPFRVPVSEVLRQESELDADLIVIDTPFGTCERFEDKEEEIINTMIQHHFLKNLTTCYFVRASKAKLDEMAAFIEEKLVPRFDKDSFSSSQQMELDKRINRLYGHEKTRALLHPVWALVKPVLITQATDEQREPGVSERIFDIPAWYARLKDQTYWGYEFIEEHSIHRADDTYMVPMDPDRAKVFIGRTEKQFDRIKYGWHQMDGHLAPSTPEPRAHANSKKRSASTVSKKTKQTL